MSHSVHNEGSVVITGSKLKNTTVSNNSTRAVTEEMWAEMCTLTGKHAKGDEMLRLLELQSLLRARKEREAKPVWDKLKPFLSQVLQHSANFAQIIGTVDALTHGH